MSTGVVSGGLHGGCFAPCSVVRHSKIGVTILKVAAPTIPG